MEADLILNKEVKLGQLYVKKIEHRDGMAIAWGQHANNNDPQQKVQAYILDNNWRTRNYSAMYRQHAEREHQNPDELVLTENDAELHATPKQTDFFCSGLTLYHEQFRLAHAPQPEEQTDQAQCHRI